MLPSHEVCVVGRLLIRYWRAPLKCVALQRRGTARPLTIEKFRFNSFLSIVANEPFTYRECLSVCVNSHLMASSARMRRVGRHIRSVSV